MHVEKCSNYTIVLTPVFDENWDALPTGLRVFTFPILYNENIVTHT